MQSGEVQIWPRVRCLQGRMVDLHRSGKSMVGAAAGS